MDRLGPFCLGQGPLALAAVPLRDRTENVELMPSLMVVCRSSYEAVPGVKRQRLRARRLRLVAALRPARRPLFRPDARELAHWLLVLVKDVSC